MSLKEQIERASVKERPNALVDPSIPMAIKGDQRVEIEFYCQNCDHYIYLTLNLALDGNHIIVCPQCSHKHFRTVKNGIITGDRFLEAHYHIADEIMPVKSAAVPSSQRRTRGNIAILKELEACGFLK